MGETVAMPGPAGERPGRWLRPLLVISLAINLLVAGAIAASVLSWRQHHGRWQQSGFGGRGGVELSLMGFARTLAPERAKMVRKTLRTERPDLRPLAAETRRARREAAAVLAAEQFDREKLVSAFNQIDAAETKLKAATRGMVVRIAEMLAPEERKALSDWWQQRKPRLFRDDLAGPSRKDKAGDGKPAE